MAYLYVDDEERRHSCIVRVDAGPLLRKIYLAGEIINASTALHEATMKRNDRAKLMKEHSIKFCNTSGVIAT